MRTCVWTILLLAGAALLGSPATAAAQYGARRFTANRATGETYHVEVGGFWWDPTPDIVISSESLGIVGDQIDFVNDLGIQKTRFNQLKIVLRPATKHKFRFEYTPINYDAQTVVQRTIVFNGQDFTIGLPVTSNLAWKAYRFGYEWDFIYRDRGFVGVIAEAKYTDIQATLSSALVGTEFTHAKAPIPALGGIARVYVAPNISITGEFTGFRLPQTGSNSSNRYGGHFYDLDIYGTVNFTDHFGVEGGYRSFDLNYLVKSDSGMATLKGIYFGAKGRF